MTAGDSVTPVLLTLNEEANLARTLGALGWARRIVVVDSGSTDRSAEIARRYPQVVWRVRPFDTHAAQWAHAVHATDITTEYVLALDADHVVPPSFVEEVEARFLPGRFDGGVAAFTYCLHGVPLGGSLYPPKPVIFRPERLSIAQPGHTQEFSVAGRLYRFAARLLHDDRKPLERFVAAQLSYSALEARRLESGGPRRPVDWLRRLGISAPIAGLLAFVRAGGPFRGAAASRYAHERAAFECLVALRLTTARLERRAQAPARSGPAGA